MSKRTQSHRDAVDRVAVGVLVCALCGSCTTYVAGRSTLAILGFERDDFYIAPVILTFSMVGLWPIIWAAFLIHSGLQELKRHRESAGPSSDPKGGEAAE